MDDGVDMHLDTFKNMANSGRPFLSNISGHWVIVDGFDTAKKIVQMRDPCNSRIPAEKFKPNEFVRTVEIDENSFIESWKRTNGSVVW